VKRARRSEEAVRSEATSGRGVVNIIALAVASLQTFPNPVYLLSSITTMSSKNVIIAKKRRYNVRVGWRTLFIKGPLCYLRERIWKEGRGVGLV